MLATAKMDKSDKIKIVILLTSIRDGGMTFLIRYITNVMIKYMW